MNDNIVEITKDCEFIGQIFKRIMERVPEDKNIMLKHLAACSIHLSFFVIEIYYASVGVNGDKQKNNIQGYEEFLEKCGQGIMKTGFIK